MNSILYLGKEYWKGKEKKKKDKQINNRKKFNFEEEDRSKSISLSKFVGVFWLFPKLWGPGYKLWGVGLNSQFSPSM